MDKLYFLSEAKCGRELNFSLFLFKGDFYQKNCFFLIKMLVLRQK